MPGFKFGSEHAHDMQYFQMIMFSYFFFLLLQNHYPDVLDYAKAAPLSWFFSMCYRVGSAVMDAKSRARIQLVKDAEVRDFICSYENSCRRHTNETLCEMNMILSDQCT